MPYEIRSEGNQFCVYKLDPDEQMKCYETEAEAKDYLAALEANVDDAQQKMLLRPTQAEVNYVTVSTADGQMCANCRWFFGHEEYGAICHIIDLFPEEILPTGKCDRWEERPAPPVEPEAESEPEMEPEAEAEDAGEMESEVETAGHVHSHTTDVKAVYGIPESNIDSLGKKLARLFKREALRPGISVLKDRDGRRVMLVVTSNSYVDREGETITTEALQKDVARNWIAEDVYHTDNPLLWWHDDRLVLGEIVYADVKGPFLVELAREIDTPLSRRVFDYRETHPLEKWGASHRFAFYDAHKDSDETYHRIRKLETSVLPREWAANPLTYGGIMPMNNPRDEYLNRMLGLENAAELLDKGIEELVSALEAQGIQHKATDVDGAQAETETANAAQQFGTLLQQLIEAQAELAGEVDAKSKALDDTRAAYEASTKALADTVAELKAELATVKQAQDARPRSAARATETTIESKDVPQSVKDAQRKLDPFWKVPVKE